MTAWLESVQKALNQVTEEDIASAEPTDRGCEHDHLVGMANVSLQKLYSLAIKKRVEFEQLVGLVQGDEEESSEYFRALTASFESCALMEMFWDSCRHKFPELLKNRNVAVRQGWRIVWCEHHASNRNLVEIIIRR